MALYVIAERLDSDGDSVDGYVGKVFLSYPEAEEVFHKMVAKGNSNVANDFLIRELPDLHEDEDFDQIAEDILYQTDHEEDD